MSRILILTLIIGLLAACGQPGSAPLPTATVPAPTQSIPTVSAPTQPAPTGTPIRVDLTPAQRAAMQTLVAAINVPIDQVQLIGTEAVQWQDGCLGIVRMGVMCMQGPIDGFRIILAANDQQYEFHTNQDGTSIGQLTKAPFVSIVVRAAGQFHPDRRYAGTGRSATSPNHDRLAATGGRGQRHDLRPGFYESAAGHGRRQDRQPSA